MNKKSRGFTFFIATFAMLLLFSTGIFAAENPSFSPDEESADKTTYSFRPYFLPMGSSTEDEDFVIVIDPGHGPRDPGAEAADGTSERELNLAVSNYCKAYLEQYDHVKVYMTRTDHNGNAKLELYERAAIAAAYNADLIICMHFNASANGNSRGSLMLVSVLEEYRLTGLADTIGGKLSELGISYQGLYLRKSEAKEYWTDNIRLADYYGLIRQAAYHEIPAIIIEHCYIDNADDYYAFADTEAKRKALGEADAKAIVSYYGLDKDISATTLENRRYTALQELEEQYLSMDLTCYNQFYKTKIHSLLEDAREKVNVANNIGKIDLTVDRTVKTLKNYPTLGEDETYFKDLKKNDWFYPAVTYCVDKNLFYGTSDTNFSPETNITRGMFITVLGRYNNVPETTPTETKFTDVDPNQYYAPHIKWALDHAVISGLTDELYGPNEDIRREDLVLILYNYCRFANIELPEVSDKTSADFKDGATIDFWAKDAMEWSISVGIIQGDGTNLHPRDNTTRAETAQVMMKFTQALEELSK